MMLLLGLQLPAVFALGGPPPGRAAGALDGVSLLQVHESPAATRLVVRGGGQGSAPSAAAPPRRGRQWADHRKFTCFAVFFTRDGFTGHDSQFFLGRYDADFARGHGFYDNAVSSFIVYGDPNCKVTLYDSESFGGWHAEFGPGHWSCSQATLRGFHNDEASSFKLELSDDHVGDRVDGRADGGHRDDGDPASDRGNASAPKRLLSAPHEHEYRGQGTRTTRTSSTFTVTSTTKTYSTTTHTHTSQTYTTTSRTQTTRTKWTATSITSTKTTRTTTTRTTTTRTTTTHTHTTTSKTTITTASTTTLTHTTYTDTTSTISSTTSSTSTRTSTSATSTETSTSSTTTLTTSTATSTTKTRTTVSTRTRTTITHTTRTRTYTTWTPTTITHTTTTTSLTTTTSATSSTTSTPTTSTVTTSSTTTGTTTKTWTVEGVGIKNGGFEMDSTTSSTEDSGCRMTAWLATRSDATRECPRFVRATDAVPAAEGSYLLELRGSGSAITQVVAKHEVGRSYTLHFSAAVPPSARRDPVVAVFIDGRQQDTFVVSGGALAQRSVDYYPASQVTLITIELAGPDASGAVLVDGVEVTYELKPRARCADLLYYGNMWGKPALGFNVDRYTNGTMKWIGCNGNGCSANTFYCQDLIGVGMAFGTTDTKALRALLGHVVPRHGMDCATPYDHKGISNAMNTLGDLTALCAQLGYGAGMLVATGPYNTCPEVHWNGADAWTSDFRPSQGSGQQFKCMEVSTTTSTTSTMTSSTVTTLTSTMTTTSSTRTTRTWTSRTRTSTTKTRTTFTTTETTTTSLTTITTATRTSKTTTTDTFTTTTRTTVSLTTTTFFSTTSTITLTTISTTTRAIVQSCETLTAAKVVWGEVSRGFQFQGIVPGPRGLIWMGCPGEGRLGCTNLSFYCNDLENGIEFGTTDNTKALRAAIGPDVNTFPEEPNPGCAEVGTPYGMVNAPKRNDVIEDLCLQLGYLYGTVVAYEDVNYCPEIYYDQATTSWTSSYKRGRGYGKQFKCEGANDDPGMPAGSSGSKRGHLRVIKERFCLDHYYGLPDDQVYLAECDRGINQQWYFSKQSLMSMHSDACLDYDADTSTAYMAKCDDGKPTQRWYKDREGFNGRPGYSDVWAIRNVGVPNSCLEHSVYNANWYTANVISLQPCDTSRASQTWYLQDSPPAGWAFFAQTCIIGHTISSHSGKTLEECMQLCDDEAGDCVAIEYGTDYGVPSSFNLGDCATKASADAGGCDGSTTNGDLYVKDYALTSTSTATVTGTPPPGPLQERQQRQQLAHGGAQGGVYVYKS